MTLVSFFGAWRCRAVDMTIMGREVEMRMPGVPVESSMHGTTRIADGHVAQDVVDPEVEDRHRDQRDDRPGHEERPRHDQSDPCRTVEVFLNVELAAATRAAGLDDRARRERDGARRAAVAADRAGVAISRQSVGAGVAEEMDGCQSR